MVLVNYIICRLKELEAMAEHCDGIIPNRISPELFFNRSWLSFDQILNFHRTGKSCSDQLINLLIN